MTIEYEKLVDARVARFLKRKLSDHAWRVEDAKAKLTNIMKRSRSGETQVIGVRKPVVVMSLEDLQEMLLGFRRPGSWGEYFYPSTAAAAVEGELAIPEDTSPSAYALEGDNSAGEVTAAPEQAQHARELEVASMLDQALVCLNEGDQDRACSIIETVISEERHAADAGTDTASQPLPARGRT